MLRRLEQSRLDNSRDAVMTELATVDLLIIDDFAPEPMTRDESRDVYQLLVERSGRAATIVTSNRDTSEWLAPLDEVLLAQSAVDRFIHNAYDLVIDGESYPLTILSSTASRTEPGSSRACATTTRRRARQSTRSPASASGADCGGRRRAAAPSEGSTREPRMAHAAPQSLRLPLVP